MNIQQLLLLAVGGYLLYKGYEYYIGQQPTDKTKTGTTGTSTPSPGPSQDLMATIQLMQQWYTAHIPQNDPNYGQGLMSFDHWNFVYQQVRGVPGPAWEDVKANYDRGKRITLNEWAALVSAWKPGFSGLSGFNGLGTLERATYFERAQKRQI
jgi:hypothetical protein